MKSNTKKILIQIISILLFFLIMLHFLPPEGGGNMGEIFLRFLKRFLLIGLIGLLISDIIIFMRRPRLIATTVALIAGIIGGFIGSILGLLSAFLIEFLTGVYNVDWDVGGFFIVSIISMALSYNFVAARIRF
ncbi:MAG: hypothetical protein WC374_10155 [Phycisphaerae bacterium]